MAECLQREFQLPISRRVLECRTLHQPAGGQSAWRRASIQIQPSKTAFIAGGFNPGGICESLCFSAVASGRRYESQRHPKPNPTLIRVGSKNGGTPVLHRLSGDAGFEFGTQVPSFSFTHFGMISGVLPPQNQLNLSTNLWLRFLGPLQPVRRGITPRDPSAMAKMPGATLLTAYALIAPLPLRNFALLDPFAQFSKSHAPAVFGRSL